MPTYDDRTCEHQCWDLFKIERFKNQEKLKILKKGEGEILKDRNTKGQKKEWTRWREMKREWEKT
jgi:hypothetical protein